VLPNLTMAGLADAAMFSDTKSAVVLARGSIFLIKLYAPKNKNRT